MSSLDVGTHDLRVSACSAKGCSAPTAPVSLVVAQQYDADGDGVYDSMDLCLGTAANQQVNMDGCVPLDVLNSQPSEVCLYEHEAYAGVRTCFTSSSSAFAPGGLNDSVSSIGVKGPYQASLHEHWNYNGWEQYFTSSSQSLNPYNNGASSIQIYLDDDIDGVVNSQDLCPSTPAGHPVDQNGCEFDEDSDGVTDSNDLCLATTTGESVNASGCSVNQIDTDDDGVVDILDLCETTAVGETVNQFGCTATDDSQDSDADGVPDYLDQCSGTQSGQLADANGCGPNQVDTDQDGIPDIEDSYPHQPDTMCIP
jgi:hypothetical protein